MLIPSLNLGLKRKALSLVELMVAILIIGILTMVTAGAVVKWMQWQRDTDNPNSPGAIALKNIKDAVERIRAEITQKARQEFTQLSLNQKAALAKLAEDLAAQNNRSANPPFYVLDANDPNARALAVYTNWKIARWFPNKLTYFTQNAMPFFCDFYGDTNNAVIKSAVESSSLPTAKMGYNSLANLGTLTVIEKRQMLAVENSLYKQAFTAYGGSPPAVSDPKVVASSCLLITLTTHPKGMKEEELTGTIAIDSATKVRYITGPAGTPIYHLLHYVDYNDYLKDKNYKAGSLRIDVGYDPS